MISFYSSGLLLLNKRVTVMNLNVKITNYIKCISGLNSFEQIWILTTWGCFRTSYCFSCNIVFEKKILYLIQCKKKKPILDCDIILMNHELNNLNLRYLRVLLHKFLLSCQIILEKKILKWSIYPNVKILSPHCGLGGTEQFLYISL